MFFIGACIKSEYGFVVGALIIVFRIGFGYVQYLIGYLPIRRDYKGLNH